MRNIIRADIYRIIRGKGLYITLAVFLAVIALQVTSGANMNTGISYSTVETFSTIEDFENLESLDPADLFHPPTGVEAPFKAMEEAHNTLYFMMPLIIFIVAADFNSGAAKNTLACGVSRAKYYCSKLILSCACCALLLAAYIIISTLAATAINGFGGVFDGEYVLNALKIFLPQLWLCIAGVFVGNFFAFVFRRSSAFIGIYIAFLLIPSILIFILSFISDVFEKLYDFELTMSIGVLTQINSMPPGDIARVLAVGAGYIAVASIGGFLIFKKAEIK